MYLNLIILERSQKLNIMEETFPFLNLIIIPNSSETPFMIRSNFYFEKHNICMRNILPRRCNFLVNPSLTPGSVCSSLCLALRRCWHQGQRGLENSLRYLCKVRSSFLFTLKNKLTNVIKPLRKPQRWQKQTLLKATNSRILSFTYLKGGR